MAPNGYGRGKGPGGRGRGANQFQTNKRIPDPRPVRYYLDEAKEQLDPSLVDESALLWAEEFGRRLKTTQLRRFYDEFKAIERRIFREKELALQEQRLKKDLALIRMLKAKALYAEKRGVSPRTFTEFIFNHVASIQDIKDLKAFSQVFEAVVAFHRYFGD